MSRKASSGEAWADIHGTQDIGARTSQQDSLASAWLPGVDDEDGERLLLVVADGMGGHIAGDIASEEAINAFMRTAKDVAREESQRLLFKALQTARKALVARAERDPQLANMGTTLTAVVLERTRKSAQYSMVSVGDSPFWHWHADRSELTRANADHSLSGQLAREVAAGYLTPEEAEHDPRREMSNVLTSALTAQADAEIEIDATEDGPRPVGNGDVLILSSDGLDTLSQDEIVRLLQKVDDKPGATKSLAKQLIDEVKAKNLEHQDNVTVLATRMGPRARARKIFGLLG